MSEPREESYDAIVVGSGLGGVSAAALLAKTGHKVLVCEQGEGAGGLAHAFTRGPYTFDSAIRVLAEGEMIENLLRFLGVEDECTLTVIDPLYRVDFPDGFSLTAPIGLEAFTEEYIRQFPHEADGIRQFFGLRRQMFLEAAQMPMSLDPRQLGDAMEKFPTLFKYRTATLQTVLDDYLTDPKLKAVCCALWPYLAMPPSQLSFFAYSQFVGVLVDGPSYCMGSFQKLVDAFVTAVERNGGELVVNTPVETILLEDGKAVGVRLEGGRELRAPIVISNADAHHTFTDLIDPESLPSAFQKRLKRLKPSLSAFVVYGVTKDDLMQYEPAHETFKYNHWDHEQTWADVLAAKPAGMSLSIMTMVDPDLAPPGENLIIVTAVAPYEADWDAIKADYTDALLAEFESVLPGLRDHFELMGSGTPKTIERYTRNHRGATYGWDLRPQQIGSKRLPHKTPIDGLYLSGHWTEEGPASFRVILSGINTATAILADAGEHDVIPSFKPDDIPGLAL